ncbi:MAG: hypothetical protein A3F94_00035 [Candidatus Spechtbacteria bacterium RIFCSPLOWO2_12_FULL_38_22]|uniref:Peptidase MA-like domain-containing protein n=1 Tax=Candidatus Spechtbacteria bacterium RIFCSPLOWO2_12_FULL_38_22 TaxID=1802165 RepID=A0A1G2HH90_9BACT|nr:MAG: hypothetical protein A2728_02545 [Candidatus Spechtbacteria bacterium RIFCSPHIGHO2_01_FULL_38_11]OGZ59192.1 MAG: hypothetical protein A3E58_00035 [Candidatus Spechtbacteria bacterium RIFCSPHIGHO2_12_FULL_38_30]OGZ60301.1 MAG: hypothetical protein A3A00_01115 [Candidatus Spechtbacteria bacterium RIFCSPLOWO2_01_FULL_38_20]OGZ61611.1 MAG: hypothetical protein A3F94_00035 [Candidatus Spechtbacteria bacterium RIFCSPLOWO2_12_FULL_38_22]
MRKIKKITYAAIILLFAVSFVAPFFSQAQINDPVYFFVNPEYETDGHKNEQITFLYSSAKAHFYIEKDYLNSLSDQSKIDLNTAVQNTGNLFDTQIYDRVRSIFGSEWNPGIDNDPKITIYFTDMPSEFNGYVRSEDESTSQFAVNSNKREMLYINAKLVGDIILPAVLAHEFQHLINYNQKERITGVKEERWLNEALSEYASTVVADDGSESYLSRRLSIFKNSPNDSLVVWDNEIKDYASVSMFIHYLADIYGDTLVYHVAHSSFVGSAAITDALNKLGVNRDFSQVYTDWTTALFLNQNFDDTKIYAYKNPLLSFLNFRVNAKNTFSVGDTNLIKISVALQDFSPQWYRFIPLKYDLGNPNFLNIKFETLNKQDVFEVAVIITTIAGDITTDVHTVRGGGSMLSVPDFNQDISSVVLVLSSHTKLSNFDNMENKFRTISIEASMSSGAYDIKNGDLLRTKGDDRVYVIKDGYRRWIPSPEVFNGYGHLKWENILEVDEEILNNYKESYLVQFIGDYKVYEIGMGGSTKNWLNITPSQFEASSRKWTSIYEINQKEYDFYREGVPTL